MASAGRRKRLVNSTFRWRVDLGGIVTWSPLGTAKSLASWPATKTWYCSGLPLGLLSFTCRKIKRKLSFHRKWGGNMVTELILWCFSDFTLFGGFLEVWKGNDYEVNSDFSVILVFCKIDKGEVGVGGGGVYSKQILCFINDNFDTDKGSFWEYVVILIYEWIFSVSISQWPILTQFGWVSRWWFTCLHTVVWRRPEKSTVALGRYWGIFWYRCTQSISRATGLGSVMSIA